MTFDETIDQGTGADGLTFTFANPALGAVPTSLGGPGGSLGYSGIPGVAVTFDTYQNGPDPSANFMGIATGAQGDILTYLATNTTIPTLLNATRRVVVTLQRRRAAGHARRDPGVQPGRHAAAVRPDRVDRGHRRVHGPPHDLQGHLRLTAPN